MQPRIGTPKIIKESLDKYILGQNEAKIALANAHFLHETKISLNLKGRYYDIHPNILLVGPSGSGKTYLAQTLSRVTGIPLVHIDCARLTATGYYGVDIYEAIQYGMQFANVTGTDDAIILLDEIDKVAINHSDSKASHYTSIQSGILAALENKPYIGNIGGSMSPVKQVNLANKFIIATGAFSNIQRFKKEEIHQDLARYGMLPELLNRFMDIVILEELSQQDMQEYLVKNLDQETQFFYDVFRFMGHELEFSDLELEAIKARLKTGGMRQVNAVVFHVLKNKLLNINYTSYIQPMVSHIRRFNNDPTNPPTTL